MNKAIFNSSSRYNGPPGYRERSGQEVMIVRPLGSDECDPEVGKMFKIQFSDGFQTDAFADELTQ